jgi:GR25 family glycosyltransferase involved in LPS biosynthesis
MSIISLIKTLPKNFKELTINNDNSFKFYIVHYDILIDRKQNLLKQFNENQIINEIYFVTDYKRDNICYDDIKLFNLNYISIGSCAITLSHLLCYYKLVKSNDNFCLIFEDDVIFNNKFNETLLHYISQLPEDWDMFLIGDGCNLHIPQDIINNKNTNVFLKDNYPSTWGGNGATRCTDSYLISKKCAHKILLNLNENEKICQNIDWWLNGIIRSLKLIVYWAEPTIVTQGTQNGIYKTSH